MEKIHSFCNRCGTFGHFSADCDGSDIYWMFCDKCGHYGHDKGTCNGNDKYKNWIKPNTFVKPNVLPKLSENNDVVKKDSSSGSDSDSGSSSGSSSDSGSDSGSDSDDDGDKVGDKRKSEVVCEDNKKSRFNSELPVGVPFRVTPGIDLWEEDLEFMRKN